MAGAWSFGLDANWIAISLAGLACFHLGAWSSKFLREKRGALLIASEAFTFLILYLSFRAVAACALAQAALWLVVLNISAIIVGCGRARTPIYSLAVMIAGLSFVVHSFSQYGSWSAVRSLPLTPPEGAFGMLLVFISYPSILDWLLDRSKGASALFIAFITIAMMLHGFRADAALILLSTFLVLWKRRRNLSYAFILVLFALFLAVDLVRTNLSIPAYERPVFRLGTTYYYSKEILKRFFSLSPPQGPFWMISIPLHPSQSIGRGIFGKAHGITPTMPIGLLLDSGLVGMLLLSAFIGLLAGHSYRLYLEGRDLFSYPVIWPCLLYTSPSPRDRG